MWGSIVKGWLPPADPTRSRPGLDPYLARRRVGCGTASRRPLGHPCIAAVPYRARCRWCACITLTESRAVEIWCLQSSAMHGTVPHDSCRVVDSHAIGPPILPCVADGCVIVRADQQLWNRMSCRQHQKVRLPALRCPPAAGVCQTHDSGSGGVATVECRRWWQQCRNGSGERKRLLLHLQLLAVARAGQRLHIHSQRTGTSPAKATIMATGRQRPRGGCTEGAARRVGRRRHRVLLRAVGRGVPVTAYCSASGSGASGMGPPLNHANHLWQLLWAQWVLCSCRPPSGCRGVVTPLYRCHVAIDLARDWPASHHCNYTGGQTSTPRQTALALHHG